jgi:hypothetical protein
MPHIDDTQFQQLTMCGAEIVAPNPADPELIP